MRHLWHDRNKWKNVTLPVVFLMFSIIFCYVDAQPWSFISTYDISKTVITSKCILKIFV